MNRHERRRQTAMDRQTDFYSRYVRHLPEIAPDNVAEMLSKPGLSHMVCFHDEWCEIYSGEECNCSPHIKYYREPERS